MTATLEVHEHADLVARGSHLVHSHVDTFAEHRGYGPAAVTISREDWLRQTGLRGGGTKRFTVRPVGPQL